MIHFIQNHPGIIATYICITIVADLIYIGFSLRVAYYKRKLRDCAHEDFIGI